jgi:hypothetical protein
MQAEQEGDYDDRSCQAPNHRKGDEWRKDESLESATRGIVRERCIKTAAGADRDTRHRFRVEDGRLGQCSGMTPDGVATPRAAAYPLGRCV